MKYASAMKYGGELIAAEDCNYNSFKELITLCPICKEPVFLRSSFVRQSKTQSEIVVNSHWSHFQDAQHVNDCEARVKTLSKREWSNFASKARGQRLKLIERWFYSVWDDAAKRGTCVVFDQAYRWRYEEEEDEDIEIAFYGLSRDSFVEEIFEYTNNLSVEDIRDFSNNECYWYNHYHNGYNLGILQFSVIKEILGFLSTKRQRFTITKIIGILKFSVFNEERMSTGNNESGNSPYDEWNDEPIHIAKYLLACLLSIDWMEEFAKLAPSPRPAVTELA